MASIIPKISDLCFCLLIVLAVIYLGSDLLGVFHFSREAGHLALKSALIFSPVAIFLFAYCAWTFEERRHYWYLLSAMLLTLVYAAIIYLVMNSGI
jgi:hypothetical protein